MSERFNEAAATWDKGDMRQMIARTVFQTIVSRISLLSNMKILDFGCGTGLLSFQVAQMVHNVTGVDLSEKMLEQLVMKNSESLCVKGLYRDILSEPLEDRFHGIVSSMAMHHVEDTSGLLKSFYGHLRKGGFIAIADLDAEDGTFHTHGNEGVHHFGFEREPLRILAENAGFSNVRFHHVHTIDKSERSYPIFLLTAHRP